MELNGLAVKLQHECHPDTCTQMTATDQWIFLCAAHKTPKECPAIDYTRHTLDGAACLLNSNKYFPSRSVPYHRYSNHSMLLLKGEMRLALDFRLLRAVTDFSRKQRILLVLLGIRGPNDSETFKYYRLRVNGVKSFPLYG